MGDHTGGEPRREAAQERPASQDVMRLVVWFVQGGVDPVCVLSGVGIRTVGEGLRGPDLAVFSSEPEQDGPWAATDELVVVVEVLAVDEAHRRR